MRDRHPADALLNAAEAAIGTRCGVDLCRTADGRVACSVNTQTRPFTWATHAAADAATAFRLAVEDVARRLGGGHV